MNSHNLLPLIVYIFVKCNFLEKEYSMYSLDGSFKLVFPMLHGKCYSSLSHNLDESWMPFIKCLFFFLYSPPIYLLASIPLASLNLDLVILVYYSVVLIISLMLCMSVLIIIYMFIVVLQNFQGKKKNSKSSTWSGWFFFFKKILVNRISFYEL